MSSSFLNNKPRICLRNEKSACDSVEVVFEDDKYILEAIAPFTCETEEFITNAELIDFLNTRNLNDYRLWEGETSFFFHNSEI